MFNIFSRSINTATRMDAWSADEERNRRRQNMINRREAVRDSAVHLRAILEEARLRQA